MTHARITHRTTVTVRYAETDAMGIVHHGSYLVYLEVARVSLIASLGLSYTEIERRGYALPVREIRVEYRKPAYFEDILTIEVGLKEMGKASLVFSYTIKKAKETGPIVVAESRHACIGQDFKVVRIPDFLVELLDKPERKTDLKNQV